MRCDQKDERGIVMAKLQFKCQNPCEPVEVVERINDDPLPFPVVLLMVAMSMKENPDTRKQTQNF